MRHCDYHIVLPTFNSIKSEGKFENAANALPLETTEGTFAKDASVLPQATKHKIKQRSDIWFRTHDTGDL